MYNITNTTPFGTAHTSSTPIHPLHLPPLNNTHVPPPLNPTNLRLPLPSPLLPLPHLPNPPPIPLLPLLPPPLPPSPPLLLLIHTNTSIPPFHFRFHLPPQPLHLLPPQPPRHIQHLHQTPRPLIHEPHLSIRVPHREYPLELQLVHAAEGGHRAFQVRERPRCIRAYVQREGGCRGYVCVHSS